MKTKTITPEELRANLDRFGKTQNDLAAELDIHHRTVYRWLTGRTELSGMAAVAVWATLDHWRQARRAVACKHWRWMPGMKTLSGFRIIFPVTENSDLRIIDGTRITEGREPKEELPDLDDPATLGCLLALVREAWGSRLLHVEPYDCAEWYVWPAPGLEIERDATIWRGETEAAALVAALEAAP